MRNPPGWRRRSRFLTRAPERVGAGMGPHVPAHNSERAAATKGAGAPVAAAGARNRPRRGRRNPRRGEPDPGPPGARRRVLARPRPEPDIRF